MHMLKFKAHRLQQQNITPTSYTGRLGDLSLSDVQWCLQLLWLRENLAAYREQMDPFCLVAPGCWWSKDVEDFFFLAHVAQCCINTTVWQLLLTMSVPLWPQFSRTVNRSAKPRIITSWFTVHCAEMASAVSRCQSNRTFGMWGNTVVFDRRVCNIWVTSSSSCVLFLAPSRILPHTQTDPGSTWCKSLSLYVASVKMKKSLKTVNRDILVWHNISQTK